MVNTRRSLTPPTLGPNRTLQVRSTLWDEFGIAATSDSEPSSSSSSEEEEQQQQEGAEEGGEGRQAPATLGGYQCIYPLLGNGKCMAPILEYVQVRKPTGGG
jgi:hypothetical protein